MKRQIFMVFSSLILLAAFCTGAAAQAVSAASKVVIQVSDFESSNWYLALNNAKNVQQELGRDKSEIEIVVYGPGIGMLKADSVTSNRVTEAVRAGIKVVACQNTMKAQKISQADMHPDIGYVTAGVVEIMKRQSEGWAYVRP
jgi:intracellular sulfur oxidation DsrE/DsrF family protein